MASTIEETTITRKTRELCQTILDEPSMQALRQRIDTFMADEQTRAQYDGLIAKGQALQEKQQQSIAAHRRGDFGLRAASRLAAEEPGGARVPRRAARAAQVQESIQKYVSKTIELGRLPSEEELSSGCCGDHGCGCSH